VKGQDGGQMMEYIVVTSNDKLELEDLVNNLIKEDWQPQGGVSVSLSESDDYKYIVYAQAMIIARPPRMEGVTETLGVSRQDKND
jgi:hypothetical protein